MMGDVVDLTAPRRLMTIIFRSLEKKLKTINPTEVHSILQPVLLKDVLILPGRSFAASANKYTPEQEALLPPQLVTHHYAGSWKNDKGGEMKRRRRYYGQVLKIESTSTQFCHLPGIIDNQPHVKLISYTSEEGDSAVSSVKTMLSAVTSAFVLDKTQW